MGFCSPQGVAARCFRVSPHVLLRERTCRRTPARWLALEAKRPKASPARIPAQEGDQDGKDLSGRSVSESREDPAMNSVIMNSMRNYFGDDGREVEKYTSRPRTSRGKAKFRVLVVGSGEKEVQIAKVLLGSGRVFGLYYCLDGAENEEWETLEYANSARASAFDSEQIIRFCKWALVDAVFVGPDRADCFRAEMENRLAALGVTIFPHDVSAAVAEGSISVDDCLAGLALGEERRAEDQQDFVG